MMGRVILQGLSPFKEYMSSWIMADNILSKNVFGMIKLESRVMGHIGHPKKCKECKLLFIGWGSSRMLHMVDIHANVLISKSPQG